MDNKDDSQEMEQARQAWCRLAWTRKVRQGLERRRSEAVDSVLEASAPENVERAKGQALLLKELIIAMTPDTELVEEPLREPELVDPARRVGASS